MSVTKFNAMLSGLLQMGSSYEWVITKKAGRSSEQNSVAAAATKLEDSGLAKLPERTAENIFLELNKLEKHDEEAKTPSHFEKPRKTYKTELAFALVFFTAAGRSLLSGWGVHFCVLIFQGVSFLFVGLGFIRD